MIAAILTYMTVSVAPGVVEARPFLRLRNGEQCEFFQPTCMVRGEVDYGREKIDSLRNQILDEIRQRQSRKEP